MIEATYAHYSLQIIDVRGTYSLIICQTNQVVLWRGLELAALSSSQVRLSAASA